MYASIMEGPFAGPLLLDRLKFALVEQPEARRAAGDDPAESQAIAAVQSGQGDSFDYLVSKYMRRVVSIAWGVIRNPADAEDLAQEAFVKAYETIGRFRTGQPFGPWIYRIVINLALDLRKRRIRYPQEALDDRQPSERRDQPDLPALSSELGARIDAAVETLPEMQRIVARLYLVEQFDHAEIAAMLGLSGGTVRSHLSLARAKLKNQLSDLYEADHE